MKKQLLLGAMGLLTCPLFAQITEFNTDEATQINIDQAGQYVVYNNDFIQTNIPIIIASDIADTVFLTLRDVNIKPANESSALVIGENSVVVLTLDGEENELSGKTTGCGIEAVGSVIINNANDSVSLTCKGSGRAAAIGTIGSSAAAGDIIINGGTIVAKAGSESAGIGASNAGRLGNIEINGGVIDVVGGAYSSAIGASYVSRGSATITINGGTITAQSGYYCKNSSIGKGNGTHSGSVSVTILGGSIMAKGETGNLDGVVYNPTNNNDDLQLLKVTLPNDVGGTLIENGTIGSIVLGVDYGIKDVYTDENGVLYFYLPESYASAAIEINGIHIQDQGETPENPDEQGVINTYGDMTNIEIISHKGELVINHTNGNLVTIMDITGKTVFQSCVKDNEGLHLPTGLYILHIETIGNFKCSIN